MFNLDFDYLILNGLLFFTFLLCGRLVSKGYSFLRCALACILVFAFVQGTRYGRGNDYMGYSHDFLIGSGNQANPTFIAFNQFLKLFGINEYSCFLVYATTFITCGMVFLSYFRKYATYIFPLFLLGFMAFEEYMIRQAFSYSFFFLFLICFFKASPSSYDRMISHKRELLFGVLWISITLVFHTGNFFNLAAVVASFYLFKKPLHPFLTIPILLVCTYILPRLFDLSLIDSVLKIASEQSDMAAQYSDNAERFFTEDGKQSKYARAPLIGLLETIGLISYFILGHRAITKTGKDKYHLFTTFFNVSVIGFCIVGLFRELEILHRIGMVMSYGWCIVVSYILYYRERIPVCLSQRLERLKEKYRLTRKSSIKSQIRLIEHHQWQYNRFYTITTLLHLGLAWFLYDYFKYLFFPGEMTRFIWDTDFLFFG